MSGQVPDIETRVARSERNRAARYREQADNFQRLAKMETEPRAHSRLLELAGKYELLADRLASPKR